MRLSAKDISSFFVLVIGLSFFVSAAYFVSPLFASVNPGLLDPGCDPTNPACTIDFGIPNYSDTNARAAIGVSNIDGISYSSSTGIFTLTPGYVIPSTTSTNIWNNFATSSPHWDEAYSWGNHADAGYLTSTSATLNFLTKNDASSTYLTQGLASTTYLTLLNAAGTYLPLSASSTFLSTSSAAGTYLTKADASTTYLTQGNAGLTY